MGLPSATFHWPRQSRGLWSINETSNNSSTIWEVFITFCVHTDIEKM